jgi:hypothetical protein
MTALTLMIIRHAEKPDEGFSGSGYTEEGDEDTKSLVIRGWQRTGAWATLFGSGHGGVDYPSPSLIYAATPGGQQNHGPSNRPAETVAPLGAKLGLTVNTKYGLGAEADLMSDVLGRSATVLICWEHHAINGPACYPSVSGHLPKKWNGDRFDVVLRFDGASPSGSFAFQELYPCPLAGDSAAALQRGRWAASEMPIEELYLTKTKFRSNAGFVREYAAPPARLRGSGRRAAVAPAAELRSDHRELCGGCYRLWN